MGKKIDPNNPPPSPQPANCTCAWTLRDYGWVKGDDNISCPVHSP